MTDKKCSVLLFCNPTIEISFPQFRLGSYKTYLLPLAKALMSTRYDDVRIIAGEHIFPDVQEIAEQMGIADGVIGLSLGELTAIFGPGDSFQEISHLKMWTENQFNDFAGLLKKALGEFTPDFIISWETPTNMLREIYPEARVLDLMPGVCMRVPYPRVVSVDPLGLYNHSLFAQEHDFDGLVTANQINDVRLLRKEYSNFFRQYCSPEFHFLAERSPKKFEHLLLVPLQISNHFGFRLTSNYKSQFDLATHILGKVPPSVGVIFTEYIGSLVSERIFTDSTIDYFVSTYPNFLYSMDFCKIDNISQYLLGYISSCATVSSTIGLQAVLLDKRLIALGNNHLNGFADFSSIEAAFSKSSRSEIGPDLRDGKLAYLLSRSHVLWEYLIESPARLEAYLDQVDALWDEKDVLARLPLIDYAESVTQTFISRSNFNAARSKITQWLPRQAAPMIVGKPIKDYYAQIEKHEIISFDFFDTLVERPVYDPIDVFLLVDKRLETMPLGSDLAGANSKFSTIRVAAERVLRAELDRSLAGKATNGQSRCEEMTLDEIYSKIAELTGIGLSSLEVAKDLELRAERQLLQPRQVGKAIYDHAKSKGKRVILVSDTSLPSSFLKSVAEDLGYELDAYYVSSEVGLKKHTGSLFGHILQTEAIEPGQVLHIGDNLLGDVKMPQESGLSTAWIPVSKNAVKDLLNERGIETTAIARSFGVKTTVALFARRFDHSFQVSVADRCNAADDHRTLVRTPFELGYLCLGPIVYGFGMWVSEVAKRNGNDFVGFLARDCYLFHQFFELLRSYRPELEDIASAYIYASRAALVNRVYSKPADVFDIRVDDISKDAILKDVMKSRFGLGNIPIAKSDLDRWGIKSENIKIRAVNEAQLYGIAHDSICANWGDIKERVDSAKRVYLDYLSKCGLVEAHKPLVVDLGYRGTIHKFIEMITGKVSDGAFFALYTDCLGGNGYEGAAVYRSMISPVFKNSDPFLKYNQVLETLLNKGEGSLKNFAHDDKMNVAKPVLESIDGFEHLSIISSIHQGALAFCEDVLKTFEPFGVSLRLDASVALEFLFNLLRNPTRKEASLLSGVIFDNAFAGREARYLVDPRTKTRKFIEAIESSVWREGAFVLAGRGSLVAMKDELARSGYDVLNIHNTSHIFRSDVTARLIFGFWKPENLTEPQGRVYVAWACEGVVALALQGVRGVEMAGTERELVFQYKLEKEGQFLIMQDGVECKVTQDPGMFGECRAWIDPTKEILIAKKGCRKTPKPQDKRSFYWQLRSIECV